ncbi:hypothetical protein B0H13DRAFT_1975024 [Mycena leptocephala]|nr:hypothetical protein B0H13DRAFT_1975024 [Mycena leptocephala]
MTQYGNEGWSSKDGIAILLKVPYLFCALMRPMTNQPTHGSDGPLKVSFGGHELFEVSKQLLDVGPQAENDRRPLGYEGNNFTFNSLNTFCNMPKWISSDGRQSDVPHHYGYNKN